MKELAATMFFVYSLFGVIDHFAISAKATPQWCHKILDTAPVYFPLLAPGVWSGCNVVTNRGNK